MRASASHALGAFEEGEEDGTGKRDEGQPLGNRQAQADDLLEDTEEDQRPGREQPDAGARLRDLQVRQFACVRPSGPTLFPGVRAVQEDDTGLSGVNTAGSN